MEEELISNGLTAYIEDNLQTALSYFSKAIEKNENNEKALLYRACTYNKLGEYEIALRDLEKVNNDSFDVSYQKAFAYFNSEKFEEAKKTISKVDSTTLSSEDKNRLNILLAKLDK